MTVLQRKLWGFPLKKYLLSIVNSRFSTSYPSRLTTTYCANRVRDRPQKVYVETMAMKKLHVVPTRFGSEIEKWVQRNTFVKSYLRQFLLPLKHAFVISVYSLTLEIMFAGSLYKNKIEYFRR